MVNVKSDNKDNLTINYNKDGQEEEYEIYIDDKLINDIDINDEKGKVNNNE